MLNMDFSKRVVIDTAKADWVPSPKAGVWRKPLAREGAEQGHATSLVRYEAGAKFSSHAHPKGEEILVLEGIFSDETDDYPAGTYFRNPEGFRHAPYSEQGCLILVKLHQFQSDDLSHVCVNSHVADWQICHDGWRELPLHEHRKERVSLYRSVLGERCALPDNNSGEEIYVVSGAIEDNQEQYPAGTWIRQPERKLALFAVADDTIVWIKAGHFPNSGF